MEEFIKMLVLNLPNFAGLVFAVVVLSRQIEQQNVLIARLIERQDKLEAKVERVNDP